MQNPDQDFEKEVSAIGSIGTALAGLADDGARRRVLSYVLSRFFPDGSFGASATAPAAGRPQVVASSKFTEPSTENEIPGVAKLSDSGELKITARDLKAKSGLDAAVRLTHIAIYAYEKFTGQPLSSRHGLTPLLKEWRLYDGNARARISRDRGIIRNDDSLSLDAHARADAERYISEVQDHDAQGSWKPR